MSVLTFKGTYRMAQIEKKMQRVYKQHILNPKFVF